MCLDSWLVCMYGGDRVLVRCGLVTYTSLALAVRGRSGFLFPLDYMRYVEVVLNIQVFSRRRARHRV